MGEIDAGIGLGSVNKLELRLMAALGYEAILGEVKRINDG